ncbi:M15 family metallopeptidase [Tessaracoccus sp. OS52]|uniref:M15 family metallopeptidase n=1 Tax=Tessaracoccus sp. OS52 TaxID=2886691 RepID=UPI001D129011|nr:M15 family metallopeptidase [Tessaracoccus sp. OS52]MCC2594522.1 M15 family metallopeptidase [Tessaracoccus sp. OS52]
MRITRRLAIALATGLTAAFAVALGPVAPAQAEVDVYTTHGDHTVNGRQWRTRCSQYSSTVERCRTEIWATTTTWNGRTFVNTNGWVFNNLTYKPSPRAQWLANPLATSGEHIIDGRRWKTECDTSWTGKNGCRSLIWATAPEHYGSGYRMVNKWVFNNIVNFRQPAAPVGRPSGPAAPSGAEVGISNVVHPGHPSTTLYRQVAPISVSGRVSGAPAGVVVTVTLRDHAGDVWDTGYATTNGEGVYSTQIDASFAGWARITAGLDNGKVAAFETTIARPSATLSAPASIDSLATPQLTGAVVPAVANVAVTPQVFVNGTWTGLGPVRTDANGRFSATYDYGVGGIGAVTVRVQAATTSGAVWTSSNSAVVTRSAKPNTVITATTPEEVNHTWRLGCPVGASRLSTIRTNYLGLDGLVHRGEIIVRRDLASTVANVLERSLAARFPLGQMRNPNHWNGDDKAMMAANNTSAFNCRSVVGNPSAQSPHSYGIAVDINPWQNPYRDPTGKWWPSTDHVQRTPVVPGQLTTSSEPVRAFRDHGWAWYSGWDWHHFQYRGSSTTATATSTELSPAATTAGTLASDDLPQPSGWDGVASEDGSLEDGWVGNGASVHEVDPGRKSVDLFALGCVAQPDLDAPVAALEETLADDGRPGVGLALEFASDDAAAHWLATWQSANRGCAEVSVAVDEPGAWEAERELHDGLWSETAQLEGTVVAITMLQEA